jgi:signal recognition particle GTPase
MDMIRISADEEKPALELTPEATSENREDSSKTLPEKSPDSNRYTEILNKSIKSDSSRYKFNITPEFMQSVLEQNKIEIPEASKLREKYFKINEAIQPQRPEDFDQPGFREKIDKVFEEFRKKLPTVPYAPQKSAPSISLPSGQKAVSISFPEATFAEYSAPYRDAFKKQLKEKFEENLAKDPTKTYNESDLDEAVELKLMNAYNQMSFMQHVMDPSSGSEIDIVDGGNDKIYNDLMQQYSEKLHERYETNLNDLFNSANKGKFTLVTGYSGAGKSTAIGSAEKIQGTPFENSDNGIVLDSDVIQAELPGYRNGVGSQATSVYALSIHRKLLQSAMQNQSNLIIPIVGGQIANVTSEITRAILAGYKDIQLKFVNTPAYISSQRVLQRSKDPGGRMIPMLVGPSSDPKKVFETLSGQDVHPETSEVAQNNSPSLDLIKKKLVDGVKERIKQQPGFAGKRIPAEQIENLISEEYPNWESYIHFTVIPASRTTLSQEILYAVRIAKMLESKKLYKYSDRLTRISIAIINKNRLFSCQR